MSEQTRIDTALAEAVSQLEKSSDSPRLDAELLLMQALDVTRSYLIAHPEDTLDDHSAARFHTLLKRRADGEPIAYISGVKEFWTLELMVSPATLVPRPETELLVQLALNQIPREGACSVVDLGTGSGAIALSLATERPDCKVTATDASGDALRVAMENARQHDLVNVEFLEGSWFEPLGDRVFDIVVSNPPYVRDDDPALAELRHEPITALASGNDGLDAVRVLAEQAPKHTAPGGYLMLEHGAEQQQDVADILAASGWQDVECHKDLAGLPRVTTARLDAGNAAGS